MHSARLSPQAVRDLDELHQHIAADNPTVAAQVRTAILDFADFITQHPGLGRRISGASERQAQIRWLVVPSYRSYLVFFQPHEKSIMVVRILHAARDWTRFFPTSPS
jgi:plasmid stabilization system protein ParE